MTQDDVVTFPGRVELCADNPLISLKDDPEGPFVALASFFRAHHSPHGRGHVLVLLEAPQHRDPDPRVINACFSDNDALAHYLVDNFLRYFSAYKDVPAMADIKYQPLQTVRASGDTCTQYREVVTAENLTIELSWRGIEEPFWFAYPPSKTVTGRHHMLSLIHGAQSGAIAVNGRVLPGKTIAREYAGRTVQSAILAFAETWIRVDDS